MIPDGLKEALLKLPLEERRKLIEEAIDSTIERPSTTYGSTPRIMTGCGWLYMTIANADGYEEVFCRLGKTGGCASSFLDGLGRLITFAINKGIPKEIIIKALKGNRCHSPYRDSLSCVDAVAQLLEREGA